MKEKVFRHIWSWSDYGDDHSGSPSPTAARLPSGERISLAWDDVAPLFAEGWPSENFHRVKGGGKHVWVVLARDATNEPILAYRFEEGGDDPSRRSGRRWRTDYYMAGEGVELSVEQPSDEWWKKLIKSLAGDIAECKAAYVFAEDLRAQAKQIDRASDKGYWDNPLWEKVEAATHEANNWLFNLKQDVFDKIESEPCALREQQVFHRFLKESGLAKYA